MREMKGLRGALLVIVATIGALGIAGSSKKLTRAGSFPLPLQNEAQWLGTVTSVNASTGKAVIAVSSAIQPDGTEIYFSNPQSRTFPIEPTTHIHYINTEHFWVSLKKLGSKTPVAVYAGDQGPARRVIIANPDPIHKPFPIVSAPNAFGMDADKVVHDLVTVPMIFPVTGKTNWSDTFLASRGGGTRRHKGQDIFAPKMRPLVACFDGRVYMKLNLGNAGHTITLEGDQGWTAEYYHVNNDTPGTDDGKGLWEHAFAPGLRNGQRVVAGQLIGWLGDSGNAENTAPHLHFEIWSQEVGACYNATSSLKNALKLDAPRVFLPMPDIPIKSGEIRLDGFVQSVDRDRNVLIMDVAATQSPKKEALSITTPQRRYIRVNDKGFIYLATSSQKINSTDLLPGDKITVVAKDAARGQAVELRDAFAFRENPLVASQLVGRQSTPASALSSAKEGTISITPADDYLQSISQSIAEVINSARREKSLSPISYKADLGRAAQQWTSRMMDKDFFDIKDPANRESLTEILVRLGVTSPKPVITSVASPAAVAHEILRHHDDIVLSPGLKWIGAGHGYIDDDRGRSRVQHYWTIIFAQ